MYTDIYIQTFSLPPWTQERPWQRSSSSSLWDTQRSSLSGGGTRSDRTRTTSIRRRGWRCLMVNILGRGRVSFSWIWIWIWIWILERAGRYIIIYIYIYIYTGSYDFMSVLIIYIMTKCWCYFRKGLANAMSDNYVHKGFLEEEKSETRRKEQRYIQKEPM